MVSRASSSAAGRLKRAKSTSSVKSYSSIPPVPDLIDPQTAHYHAMAAASVAMKRSNQRSSMDFRDSCDISSCIDSETDGGFSRASRPRSIRFSTGDNSSKHNRQPFQSPNSVISPNSDTAARSDPSFHAVVEALTPRMSEMSGSGDSVPSVPSVPSSYRRLRKAKSMFLTRKHAFISSDSSYSPRRAYHYTDSPEMGHLSRATLRRSKSFFGTETSQQSHSEHMKRLQSHNAAVQLAREQYLELKQPMQSNGAESILSKRGRHQSKPFRKSLRSSTDWDAENCITSDRRPLKLGILHPSDKNQSSKSRIFSVSIKNSLKRIFGRNSVAQVDMNAPSERQRTRRLGFSDFISSDSTGTTNFGNRPASVRTMRSSDSYASSSRVTSWTDSTTVSTMAARDAVSDRHRLAIIQEIGAPPEPIPSPTSFHYNDGYSVFRKPLCTEGNSDNSYGVVDSQRVYSALVRHIDESQHHSEGDVTPRAVTIRRSMYSPSSSVHSNQMSSTIRHIPSEVSMKTIRALSVRRSESPSLRSQMSVGSSYRRDALGFTPQEVAQRNENLSRHRSRESLRESRPYFFQSGSRARAAFPNPLVPPLFSSYKRAMGSEGDTGSVIISRPDAVERTPISPSVYSRTSGETPRNNGSRRDLSFSESSDERGTVTILASERLPYKPKEYGGYANGDRPTRGSADWKSWMSLQMDLLDATPDSLTISQYCKIPNTHYRESTQINDEMYDNKAEEMPPKLHDSESPEEESPQRSSSSSCADRRLPLVELKSFTRNNFSRPLRLSPDISISISHATAQRPSVVARSESPRSIHIKRGDGDSEPITPSSSLPRKSVSRSPSSSPLVYAKPRYSGSALTPVTPTKASKTERSTISVQNTTEEGSLAGKVNEARKLTYATNFSSVRNKRDDGRVNNENSRGVRRITKNDLSALGDIHSTISSKRMVDIFLSQRRRQQMGVAENTTENAFL
ncbi:hypothetical protein PABG_00265 [Paracoccidioides brasiliensis Pb03]|nr:hypothetical protein PABG_00265 [Paracoccidioides brasiliensis Pb03]